MFKVGIIDSGIDQTLKLPVHDARSFFLNDNDITEHDIQDQLGHGSALAQIIGRSFTGQAKLLIAKVFFEKLVSTPAQIAAALDWQIAAGARVINMSFGLHTDRPIVRAACQRAVEAGVTLVAAAPARGAPVYPATYPGVVRATGDARCQQGQISYLNTTQADFGGHVRANTLGSHAAEIAGASVGCAYITSSLANILSEQPGLNPVDMINQLIAQANYFGPENRSIDSRSRRYY